MAELSPMMKQYMATKEEYKDCLLFYRLGDFYEMFFDDAVTASRELELVLTGKECGLEERAPMCGIPHHAVDSYLNKLVAKGYKVAIAEQLEDPKTAKGIVKRDVIRVVTPGTLSGENALDENKNNYLCYIAYIGNRFGICMADITTGAFKVTEVDTLRQVEDELSKFAPSEILANRDSAIAGLQKGEMRDYPTELCEKTLKEHFRVQSPEGLGLKDYPAAIIAAGSALCYIYDTQKHSCANITSVEVYHSGEYMVIDSNTRRNLELTETMRNKERKGTLLWVLDKTGTAMGARLLRNYIEQPLLDIDRIRERQDAVGELLENYISHEELCEYLKPVYDLERLMGRISSGLASPRDLIALKSSGDMIPAIRGVLSEFKSAKLTELFNVMDPLTDIRELIESAIDEEPPLSLHEGGIIKSGFNEEIDKLRQAKSEGKNWLAQLETKERERTGIKTLRIKYNKVFGYCIEVTNAFKNDVPEDYMRKQTLVNCERYMTQELKELEDIILGAEDRLISLEYNLFAEIREKIAADVERIQKTAGAVAETDVLSSLATAAYVNNYSKPKLNSKGVIEIRNGRHPVVEKVIGNDKFIANDTLLDEKANRVAIITGPNMAGKSTYMRQTALIVLMAQIGSFIPAEYANIGICDKVFTRVGASDDLAAGQSTFMVEMTEVANILRNATRNSLIIMDEIGRGTSTFDGLSIAWAVVEHVADTKKLGAKTLFATHYHELTELEGTLEGVQNYCIAVKEQGDDIVFLRKIVKGGADKSYGIQVARLAGVPDSVLNRAKELAAGFAGTGAVPKQTEVEAYQYSLFDTNDNDAIIDEISNLDITSMTPIDAMNTLNRLQNEVRNRI